MDFKNVLALRVPPISPKLLADDPGLTPKSEAHPDLAAKPVDESGLRRV